MISEAFRGALWGTRAAGGRAEDAAPEAPVEWALEFLSEAMGNADDPETEPQHLREAMRRSVPALGDRVLAVRARPDGELFEPLVYDRAGGWSEPDVTAGPAAHAGDIFAAVLRASPICLDPLYRPRLEQALRRCPGLLDQDSSSVLAASFPSGELDRLVLVWIAGESRHTTVHVGVARAYSAYISGRLMQARTLAAGRMEIQRRQRSEAAIREGENRIRALLHHLADPVFVLGLDGRVLDANRAATEQLGYTREELLTLEVADFVDAPDECLLGGGRWLREGEQLTLEAAHRRRDGSTFPVEIRLAMVAMGRERTTLAVSRDVTERVRATEALRERESHFRALIENSIDAVSVLDRDGTIRYHSPASRMMLGIRAEELVGRRFVELVQEADRAGFAEVLERLLVLPAESLSHRFAIMAAPGPPVRVEATCTNGLDAPGVHGFVVNYRDVTESERLSGQLQHAHKLEAVGRLAGGVAHDFNNILTVITGTAALRINELPPGDPSEDDLREILAAAERASALTRQLLAVSRRQIFALRSIDVGAVVEGMTSMLSRVVGEDLHLEVNPNPAWIKADQGQLEQVVLNLVVNARDAVGPGGRIGIRSYAVVVGAGEVSAVECDLPPGRYGVLSVKDDGTGIPEDVLPHVFEPFYTTKASAGTGLGLASVYGIVRQSGGYIAVNTAIGAGTEFSIFIPETSEAPAAPPAPVREDTDGGGRAVLVAEDDPGLRALTARILRRAGYEVLTANDGLHAEEVLESGGAVDLVLTDVIMPRMGGPQLAKRLRSLRPGLPVLLMSGYADQVTPELVQAGYACVSKPFTPDDLIGYVRRALNARTAIRTGRPGLPLAPTPGAASHE